MSVYDEVFGGNTIYPSDVSYLALSLTANTQMYWPLDANTGSPVLARIVDITPSAAYAMLMPDATLTGPGQTFLFNNLGPYVVTIKDYAGNTLASLSAGEQWELYLTDNTTAAGVWRAFRFGAATAQAQASALAGYGLAATGATLSQSTPTSTLSTTYTVGASDRAKLFVWTGGLGTLNMCSVSAVMNGFAVSFNNQGAGDWTLTADGSDLIDGETTLVLSPGESVTLATDSLSWYSLGLGPAVETNFDYTLINLTGQTSPYTLSGAELNRVAYSFAGTLTANMVVVVPSTVQEYWVTNATTGGSYTLSFRTAAQTPAVIVARGSRGIYYCNGSDFISASTGGIATPIAVVDGGTGSATAGGALTNLGGTAVGTAVFTASSAGAARTALGSSVVGDAVFVASTSAVARTALGSTAVGDAVFVASTAGVARTALGSTTVGDAVFIAASTGAAQTALALVPGTNVQAQNANLQAISGVTSAADKLFYFTGSGTGAVTDITSVARTLVAQTTQALMRTTGLGMSANGSSLVAAADYTAMRVLLGLEIGVNVQAQNANLQAISGVTSAADKLFYFTGSGTGAVTDLTSQSRNFLAASTGSAAMATLFTPGTINNTIKSDGAGGWVVGAAGGITYATTTVSSPVASVSFTSIPAGYSTIILEIDSLVLSASDELRVTLSPNNLSTTIIRTLSVGFNTTTWTGLLTLPDYTARVGCLMGSVFAGGAGSGNTFGGTQGVLAAYFLSGGVNSLRISTLAGANITGGTITVKLV